MRFAKYVFWVAGVVGLLEILPLYFAESIITPPLNHPEFYYGFLGVVVAWQMAFILIGTLPEKFRAFILPAIIEKASYVIAGTVLYSSGRMSEQMLPSIIIDCIFALLFIISYFKTANQKPTA